MVNVLESAWGEFRNTTKGHL